VGVDTPALSAAGNGTCRIEPFQLRYRGALQGYLSEPVRLTLAELRTRNSGKALPYRALNGPIYYPDPAPLGSCLLFLNSRSGCHACQHRRGG
jgi:hypothetical protein